jgi:hypothetical protein
MKRITICHNFITHSNAFIMHTPVLFEKRSRNKTSALSTQMQLVLLCVYVHEREREREREGYGENMH